jgi:hypothetical protein
MESIYLQIAAAEAEVAELHAAILNTGEISPETWTLVRAFIFAAGELARRDRVKFEQSLALPPTRIDIGSLKDQV